MNGGRWNPKGVPVIYTSASPSLAALEILVHYSVLPIGFVLTSISVPESVLIEQVPEAVLVDGWDDPATLPVTKEFGRLWTVSNRSLILRVPSTVIRGEANYVINVLHPDFPKLTFGQPDPFRFDPRLK